MATKLYDAIVSTDGKSDYLLPSAAFNDGNQSIFVREGVYVETGDVVIPTSGSMTGETRAGIVLNFAGTAYGVKCDANPAHIETAGTISVTNGSATVTGTGTTFTNLAAGNYISIGTVYAKIAAIGSNTSLTIVRAYRGVSLVNINYQAMSMFSGIAITNINIAGSTSTGLYVRGCRQFDFDSVAVSDCSPNIFMEYSGDSSATRVVSYNGTGNGFELSNCISISNSILEVINNTVDGVAISGVSTDLLFKDAESSGNGVHGFHVSGTATDTNFSECVTKFNASIGIWVESGSSGMAINSSNSTTNGSHGLQFDGDDIVFSGGLVQKNGGNGIVVNGNRCIVTKNICKNNTEALTIGGVDNIVSSNVCQNSTTYGCHILSTGNNNSVTYNNLRLCGYGTYYDEGTNSDMTGNIV
jgi:hypothetical protein